MSLKNKPDFFINTSIEELYKKKHFLDNKDNCLRIKEKCSKYKIFSDSLMKTTKKIHNESRYISQGCCQIDNITLLTYYDSGYEANKKGTIGKSILEIIDDYGREKTLYFDNDSHVGGIAYSKEYNKIYVTRYSATKKTNATICSYDVKTIASLKNNTILSKEKYQLIELPECINVSYITINKDILYVGDFYNKKIVTYKLLNNGLSVKYIKTYKLKFNKVQGMCIYTHKNNDYYIFSCSYGRRRDSILRITKLIDDNFETIYSYKLPCMSEQVSLDTNNNLMIIFESDSLKYSKGIDNIIRRKATNKIDSVCHIDIEKILLNNSKK